MTELAGLLAPTVGGLRRVICCHSGTLSGAFPPNSLGAIAECAAAGVPRLEVDVRFMADDSMLVFHDQSLERESTGSGVVANLSRRDLDGVRYRRSEREPVCFLEEVVDLLRGSATVLQVDLKLMRPISRDRVAALTGALRPLDGRLILGSQAHWNLRAFSALPVAFDPTLQWHYDPRRKPEEAWPRTLGVHGLWDDAPLASNRLASASEYAENRIADIHGLLPNAVEWMVDFETIRYLTSLGIGLGSALRTRGVSLAAWTLRDNTPRRATAVGALLEAGVETIITDAPRTVAADIAALTV